ncbi:MAG: hypothetical protein JEY71_00140 [Sphaerochaeta sp.]|nr:hypothetical protein [Sphaerochaeta sp.]
MRTRVFLLALVGVLLVCLPLFAVEEKPFSLGIFSFQDDSSSLLQVVEDAGTTYANQFIVPSEAYNNYLIERQRKEIERSMLQGISSAYASKSAKDLEKAREMPPQIRGTLSDRLPVTYRQIPYQKGFAKLLASYPDARSWFASQEKLDALVLINTTKLASNDRIRLYWYEIFSDTTTLIFDRVLVNRTTLDMQEEIGRALLAKTAGPKYGLLIFDNYTSSIRIDINSEPLVPKGGQELLPFGDYTISLGGELYVPAQIEISLLPNTIAHVSSTLERAELGDILLSSTLGKVQWFVDGSFRDTSVDLSISSSMVPLVIVAQKEGFASKTLQVYKPVQEISVSLQPQWMTSSALLQEEQKGFYKSLRNTMLIFGLYVASATLSQTFEEANPLWQPLQVATSGFALVSTLHTIMNLASYAALASSGVR